MSLETEWLDNLISSHKKKLEEIRQWQGSYPYQTSPQQRQSSFDQPPFNSQAISYQITSDAQPPSDLSHLTMKVSKQKTKIKSLKTTLNLLSEENTSLKHQLFHLDNYSQTLAMEKKKASFNQTSQREQEQSFLIEISHLKETITLLESRIDKMTRLDCLKSQDIELLNQKAKDLEVIVEENAKNASYELDKLLKDNEVFKEQLNDVDKLFEAFNYFVKRMRAQFPKEVSDDPVDYLNMKEYQNRLIQIENGIVNEKNRLKLELKERDESYHQQVMMLNKKIEQLTTENKTLEEKGKEGVSAFRLEEQKRSPSTDYSRKKTVKKAKRAPKALSKAKSKK